MKAAGCSGSPLPLADLLRLRQTIASSATTPGSQRLVYPPAILSCCLCHHPFQRPACEAFKMVRRRHTDYYCSTACSQAHHAVKNRRRCRTCGAPVLKKTRGYCEACRPPRLGRRLEYPPQTKACPICNTQFLAKWRGRGSGKYAVYCSKFCAERGHSRLMSGLRNPKWKDGATPLRQQPHSAKAFRLMRPLILQRDEQTCVVCHSQKSLHVHHLDDWPMNNAASNLVTLCSSCHRKWHVAKDSKPSRILWSWLRTYTNQPLSTTSK